MATKEDYGQVQWKPVFQISMCQPAAPLVALLLVWHEEEKVYREHTHSILAISAQINGEYIRESRSKVDTFGTPERLPTASNLEAEGYTVGDDHRVVEYTMLYLDSHEGFIGGVERLDDAINATYMVFERSQLDEGRKEYLEAMKKTVADKMESYRKRWPKK